MSKKLFYLIYIGIGLLYVIIKLIYVSAGYLHVGAIFHGLVPAVLMTAVGLLGLKSLKNGGPDSVLKFLIILLPALLFVITPPFMYFKQGAEWLTQGRFSVLIIYEVLSAFQFFYSLKKHKV